jgi:aspartokinase-like uncharacterized kinase
MSTIIAKVGGSLFDLPDLRQRIAAFLASKSPDRVLFVPGGGAGADVIRSLDRTHGLGDEASHWLALRVLSINAQFLARLLSIPVVDRIDEMTGSSAILDALEFCRDDDARHGALPHRWDVTSDSIAARVAALADAELIMFKSVDLPDGMTWKEAAERGYVDGTFPDVAKSIHVTWVNLRQPTFAAIPEST